MDLRKTLNLPDPDATIPMKANLPSLEPAIQSIWAERNVYARIQEARQDAPVFVLHDGPPYTNSPIHIGTAMNKILKDFVLKSRTMMGYWAPYVPGFDTHGLPIEMAVTKKLADQKMEHTGAALRKACREHVAEFIGVQSAQFQRLGVFGLWEKPYATLDFKFEAEIVRTFGRLAEKGLTYRGLRPTQWSPTLRTALADTEIVYQEGHVSKAIYVAFEMEKTGAFDRYFEPIYAIIWTTTPWTIPANLALAFHHEFDYALVSVPGHPGLYLLAEALVEKVAAKLGWEGWQVMNKAQGEAFEGMTFRHPIFGRPSVGVLADYVTAEDGTGIVHTAPSHGRDDFYTGQKYGLPVPNTVNERGVLTEETGEFAGTYFKDCDTKVVDRLAELGYLLLAEDYVHSYPYAERDGKPV
ncbi:isoleucine--tRNA ligase, partial [bacterium]